MPSKRTLVPFLLLPNVKKLVGKELRELFSSLLSSNYDFRACMPIRVAQGNSFTYSPVLPRPAEYITRVLMDVKMPCTKMLL